MKKKDLKSFDIASYDIEIEYNSKIAPIIKKITKLNKNHETKSLKSHKDFLTKEKQSKEKLNVLSEKAILKDQRIEKAVENKLSKFRNRDQRIKKEFSLFKAVERETNTIKVSEIDQIIKDLKVTELEDIEAVQVKYQENVKSYVEKLDTYTSNYENNCKIHGVQIKKYSKLLNKKLDEIDNLKALLDTEISEKLQGYLKTKVGEDEKISSSLSENEKLLNGETQKLKIKSNVKVKNIKIEIKALQDIYIERFNEHIEHVESHIEMIKTAFEKRSKLIDRNLQINLDKIDISKEESEENKSKNSKKTIKMKIDLFNLRASTTKKYEEFIFNEKILILKNEVNLLRTTLNNEIMNLDKLEVFLLNDQNEIKDTSDYFKNLNVTAKNELNIFELANNDYLVKHEHLKTEFIRKYTVLFDNFKRSLLSLNKASIDQLTVINQELDEINKYLDTSEPLKEIEVNKLRENIEVTEIKERYNIKYAKQQHEIKILNNELDSTIAIEETNVKSLLSENNKDITDVKNKEILDKASEKAKLKYNKADEIFKLRLNNIKLERNVLKSSFETELEVYDYEKDITRYEVQKNDILVSKEINNSIENIESEANYKIEVINKHLEEDLLKLDEQVSRLIYEQDAFSLNVDLAISKERFEIDKQKNNIFDEMKNNLSQIDIALAREIKEPMQNMTKSNSMINHRLRKLDLNNDIFNDFIKESNETLFDENLTINQIKELTATNLLIYEESTKYIEKTYDSLKEAITFMNELEKRSVLNKISTSADQGQVKKYKKRLAKQNSNNKKQFNELNSSRKDKENAIKNQIKTDLLKLSKQKTENIESLREMVINVYESCFISLKNLQKNILDEIILLYSPLTKTDNELVVNAQANAEKAKKHVHSEQIERLKPLDTALSAFIDKFEENREGNSQNLEEQIKKLRDSIYDYKQKASNEIREINDDKDNLSIIKKEQLGNIDESEETEIVKQIELLDGRKNDLKQLYHKTLDRLHDKDDEAKKIYSYEKRIYNIALETATSRFNDSNIKTENANLLNVSVNNKSIGKIKKDSEKYLRVLNQELLGRTKKFEKNIFTTRPRLEESIGDAQKAIETEITSKQKRLKQLMETHSKITQSLEDTLFTSFQEGYEKLLLNLSYYLEK